MNDVHQVPNARVHLRVVPVLHGDEVNGRKYTAGNGCMYQFSLERCLC